MSNARSERDKASVNASNTAHQQKVVRDTEHAHVENTSTANTLDAESYAGRGGHGWEPLP